MRSMQTVVLAALALLVAAGGCYEHRLAPPGDGDGDGDADGDSDGDVDGDSDGDGDTDIDGDADGDGDGDLPLVVHEWGVFTEGATHAGPGIYASDMADKPVLYFYADRDMTVRVEVDLVGGTARETWPELSLAESIAWPEVVISPEPCAEITPFPSIGEGQCEDPWYHHCEATELGSYTVADASCTQSGGVRSPLLFYAGAVGQAPLALSGSFSVEARLLDPPAEESLVVLVDVENTLDEPVGPVFLVYRDLSGDCQPWGCQIQRAVVATMWLEQLLPGDPLHVELEAAVLEAGVGETVQAPDWLLAEEQSLATVLTDAGLTEAEATAMLNGWRHTFFDLQPDDNMVSVPLGESLGAVYPVPRSAFDDSIPIRIEPSPRELVRVGLGYQYLPIGSDVGS